MYSNKKNGFSILDLLVKIIFAAVFIFILIWLFNKKIPKINMTPFYSNVFRENIKYMQEAGENYFTDDKMPTEEGEEIKLTLGEMESKNLLIPFVDEDGNACDKNESYVSITKLEEGYELKTNLVCPKQTNFTVKALGCHTYCKTGNCEKKCSIEKITQYQYKKLINGSKTTYSCPKGTKLSGKYCLQTKLIKTKNPIVKTVTKTDIKPATPVTDGAQVVKLTTVVTNKKTQLKTEVEIKKTILKTTVDTKTTELKAEKTKETFDCTKTKTEKQCTETKQTRSYSCQCKTTVSRGRSTTTCNTCYETVPVQSCKDVEVSYTDTCYKEVTSCPKGTTDKEGSGANLKCYKKETVYGCPSGTTDREGSGATLKCIYAEPIYSCPSGTTYKEGSGANLKCYKVEKVYSCPSGTTYKEGSGANLKCYRVVSGSLVYKCTTSGYKLDGKNCVKVISISERVCADKGYKLEGNKCNLYKTTKTKAKSSKKTSSYYTYIWSEKESLPGYTKTGKTKTINGKEVCE